MPYTPDSQARVSQNLKSNEGLDLVLANGKRWHNESGEGQRITCYNNLEGHQELRWKTNMMIVKACLQNGRTQVNVPNKNSKNEKIFV